MILELSDSPGAGRRVWSRSWSWFSLGLAFGLAWVGGGATAPAQTGAGYAGRPFVRIARAATSDPSLGIIAGFGRGQYVGQEVVIPVLGAGFEAVGLVAGRGGPLALVVRNGNPDPTGETLGHFQDAFVQRGGDPGRRVLAIAAGVDQADSLLLSDGAALTLLLASGTLLPGSGGKPLNRLGEPNLVNGRLVVIGWHQGASGVDFRGVYEVMGGSLNRLADTVTTLPGVVGVPDTFSSQVGFDGTNMAFWASGGEGTETQGIFKRMETGTVVVVASSGDPLPGGGIMTSFLSPPVVDGGSVWFFAQDADRRTHLLRERDGTLGIVARDGDPAPEGGLLESLGQSGLEVNGGRVFFAARTAAGPGLYVLEAGAWQAIIPGGGVVAGLRPTAITLQDVEGDTIVLQTAGPAAQPAMVVANPPNPAVPVIVRVPESVAVPAGAAVNLQVVALGDAPLSYLWRGPAGVLTQVTGDTLRLASASAVDVGYYSVQVTNPVGQANSSSFLVNVEVGPTLTLEPQPVRLETGDTLQLRVVALGGLPMGYSWTRDGKPATNATSSGGNLVKNSAEPGDSGTYQVVVTNAYGTATSAPVTVVVDPPGPNPAYAGAGFENLVDSLEPAAGLGLTFSAESFHELAARWWGSRIVFAGQSGTAQPLGLFAADSSGVTALVPLQGSLPNGLGPLGDLRLVRSSGSDDPLMVIASSHSVPVGLYRLRDSEFVTLADVRTEVPGAPGEVFMPFYISAAQAGEKVAFLASTTNRWGAYLAGDGPLRRLVDTRMDLPRVGTAVDAIQSIGFDGQATAVVVSDRTQSVQAVLRIAGDGRMTALVGRDDPIPGTPQTIRTFGPVAVAEGVVYFLAFDAAFARHFLAWRDGVVYRLAGPGTEVPGIGTLTSVESPYVLARGGKVYLTGRIQGGTSGVTVVFAASITGLEPVLNTVKLDGRRLSVVMVVDAAADRVLLATRYQTGGGALYANVGSGSPPAPVLLYTRRGSMGLRVTVTEGTTLESAEALGGSWSVIPGTGSVDVPFEGAKRFLRLRRP